MTMEPDRQRRLAENLVLVHTLLARIGTDDRFLALSPQPDGAIRIELITGDLFADEGPGRIEITAGNIGMFEDCARMVGAALQAGVQATVAKRQVIAFFACRLLGRAPAPIQDRKRFRIEERVMRMIDGLGIGRG